MQPHSLKQTLAILECPRKWAAKWLFGCDDPKSPWAQDGIDAHNACKAWLRTGKFDYTKRRKVSAAEAAARGVWGQPGEQFVWIEETVPVGPESHTGKLAAAAVAFAPQGALPEMDQAFDLFGRTVECHIDCLWPDWSEFADWKFTSGYRDLTEAELPVDMQANWQSYGICKASSQSAIKGLWVFVSKKNYRAKPVRGNFPLTQSEAFLRAKALPAMQAIEMFSELHDRGKLTSLAQIPHDITACDGSGRFCNFLGQCRMAPSTGASLIQLRNAMKG